MNKATRRFKVGDLVTLKRGGMFLAEGSGALSLLTHGTCAIVLGYLHNDSLKMNVIVDGQSGFLFETQLESLKKEVE